MKDIELLEHIEFCLKLIFRVEQADNPTRRHNLRQQNLKCMATVLSTIMKWESSSILPYPIVQALTQDEVTFEDLIRYENELLVKCNFRLPFLKRFP